MKEAKFKDSLFNSEMQYSHLLGIGQIVYWMSQISLETTAETLRLVIPHRIQKSWDSVIHPACVLIQQKP